ncbi:MAG: hypothetical protein KGL39_39945 [Patescibacteria group bacterium]|nr:hypothetical protein [Patescibacteria group bacterium]
MLDPDMKTDALLLAMGEMTAQEIRTARAAIRWANSAIEPLLRQCAEALKYVRHAEPRFYDNIIVRDAFTATREALGTK